MITLASDRECFFDDYLVDIEKTTAEFRLHSPQRREIVLVHDAPWEGDGCDYHNILYDDGIYRMYYLGWQMLSPDKTDHKISGIRVCYAESKDGLNWTKPSLGICKWDGSYDNNIILDETTASFDNFMVFKDTNPSVHTDERYKGVAKIENKLMMFTSSDGLRFTMGDVITDKGHFDSLNVAFWDERAGIYRGYIRDFHNVKQGNLNVGVRDIRYISSKDGKKWSDPVMLDFGEAEDYPLYTNCVTPYLRATQIYIGFPSRYVEHEGWDDNFERLTGKEKRLERMKVSPRYGLTVTDCVFMVSRDGIRFKRYDEAFMRPGPENGINWVYGDCYPARGLIETPSVFEGEPPELSIYAFDNHWMGVPSRLWRYTLRRDGFVSMHAGYSEKIVITKPFTFTGSNLHINFSTSARGYLKFSLFLPDGKVLDSVKVFGDSDKREVPFEGKDLKDYEGSKVVMQIRIRDADIYSIQFV